MSGTRLSQRVRELPASQTMALAARARDLKGQGRPVIDFSVGEPDFTSPPSAMAGARGAIERGETHYPPVPGTPALRAAIAARVLRETGREVDPGQVVVSNGAKHTLYNLLQVLVDPGDEVVFTSPYWVSYPAMAQLAGGRAVPVPTRAEDGFRLDPAAIEASLGGRTKVLILNSPCNPTGAVAAPEDLEAVVRLALERDVMVISDEIYGRLVFDGATHKSALSLDDPRVAEQVVLVDGVSKSHAMTGWRVGYAVGPLEVIKAVAKIQGQSTSGVNGISQAAATQALEEGEADVERFREAFAARRVKILEGLAALPGISVPRAQGAFYAFPDVSSYFGKEIAGVTVRDSASFSELLLEKALIAAVPGSAFGADAHLRFSYALSEAQIQEGLDRLEALLVRGEAVA